MTESFESVQNPVELPEGERWLHHIGYGHLIGQPSGRTVEGYGDVLAEDVVEVFCYAHAAPFFRALEQMDPNNPETEADFESARLAVRFYCPGLFTEE